MPLILLYCKLHVDPWVPQKLPEYLFSAKPIIHSYSGKYCVVSKANAGISVPAESPESLRDAILNLKGMTEKERKKIGRNGRSYAIKHFDYKVIAKKFNAFISSKA